MKSHMSACTLKLGDMFSPHHMRSNRCSIPTRTDQGANTHPHLLYTGELQATMWL